MFFWISQLCSANQNKEVETTETVEPIRDLKLPNQKLMNLITMKTVVMNLMIAITINLILMLKTKKEQIKILIKVASHTQDVAHLLLIFDNLNIRILRCSKRNKLINSNTK